MNQQPNAAEGSTATPSPTALNHPTPCQVKHLLRAYAATSERLRLLKMQLENIGSNDGAAAYAASVTQVNDGMPRPPQPGDKTASVAMQLMEAQDGLRQRLEARRAILTLFEQQMRTALAALPDFERTILQEKYIKGNNWKQVYFKVNDQYPLKSESTLFRKAHQAVNHLSNLLYITPENYRVITCP